MYLCNECGHETVKWQGQCEMCKTWNSLKEFREAKVGNTPTTGDIKELTQLSDVQTNIERINSTSSELNTVLGGGMVPGSVILLSGEPGIGKSTLTLQLGSWIDEEMIYVSGEETEYQISDRAKRL